MNFLYNVWQNFKRNIFLHLLTLCMLVVLFYITTNVVGYQVSNDNFFDYCGYNKEYADTVVVEFDSEKFESQAEWDEFVVNNKFNEDGCSASYNIDGFGLGNMISKEVAHALKLKVDGNYFSKDYIGNGKEKPFEILVNAQLAGQYEISREYVLTGSDTNSNSQINVKVIGYFDKYSIRLSFLEFRGFFESNAMDYLICGTPTKNFDRVVMLDAKKYAENRDIFEIKIQNSSSLKAIYDSEKQITISYVASNIVRIVIVYLVLVMTILSFTFFKYDNAKKYNYIKKVTGENKVTNICSNMLINAIIFVLAVVIVCIIGAVDPDILGGVFPNIGFWVSISATAVTYFGMSAVSVYKVNNFLNK